MDDAVAPMAYFTIIQKPGNARFQNGGYLYSDNIRLRLKNENIPVVYISLDLSNQYACGPELYRRLDDDAYIIGRAPFKEGSNIGVNFPFFMYEEEGVRQRMHVTSIMKRIIDERGINAFVTDYLYACVFLNDFNKWKCKKFIVSCNNEFEFYRDCIKTVKCHIGFMDRIRIMRLSRFERKMYNSCEKVVFISNCDRPRYLNDDKVRVVTCYLDPKPNLWEYANRKNIYYIGNYAHYPNKLAIDYIIDRIAPLLYASDPSIRIDILGANDDDVGGRGCPNVRLMG